MLLLLSGNFLQRMISSVGILLSLSTLHQGVEYAGLQGMCEGTSRYVPSSKDGLLQLRRFKGTTILRKSFRLLFKTQMFGGRC